jgi:hypothetical protein
VALIVACIAGYLSVIDGFWTPHRTKPVCAALDRPVGSLQLFRWDNGITESGATWNAVLGEGVIYADAPGRRQIAVAVREDRAGYERLRAAVPTEFRPALGRLRLLASDPASGLANRFRPQVVRDALSVTRFAAAECGYL